MEGSAGGYSFKFSSHLYMAFFYLLFFVLIRCELKALFLGTSKMQSCPLSSKLITPFLLNLSIIQLVSSSCGIKISHECSQDYSVTLLFDLKKGAIGIFIRGESATRGFSLAWLLAFCEVHLRRLSVVGLIEQTNNSTDERRERLRKH